MDGKRFYVGKYRVAFAKNAWVTGNNFSKGWIKIYPGFTR